MIIITFISDIIPDCFTLSEAFGPETRMLKGDLRDLEMFRVEVQRSHTSTSGEQDLFYSLKMVHFGGEYQVLVANCA